MVPEKIANSHLLKLNRMLEDIARASKDLEALRLAYQRIAAECALYLPAHQSENAEVSVVPGQLQAARCGEIVAAHAAMKQDIERVLLLGTDGKQVAALQVQLDALEDERDALDADLRLAQRSLAMRRPIVMEDPP